MKLMEKDSVQWLQFDHFSKEPKLIHGFTTRNGGASNPPFSSLNMGLGSGDKPEHIEENYRRILTALGVENRNRYMTRQVHSDRIRIINDQREITDSEKDRNYIEAFDGLLTNRLDVVLMTYYADCVPLFFYDPVNHAGGVVHSGWKGTAQQIGRVAVEHMQREFSSRPEDILVGIGPCAGICCYEIGQDVVEAFNWMPNLDSFIEETKPEHWRIDLKGINRSILIEAGIPDENIEITDLCTMCRTDILFSYRKEKPLTGRMSGILALG